MLGRNAAGIYWMFRYLERCENNDRHDTYGGAPVTQRTDVQTDLSFYRNR